MHFTYLVGLLGAVGATFALPVSNNDKLESAPQDLEKRFYYTNYEGPEKRDVNVENSEEDLEKRFYYTHYESPEKRDEEATDSV
ncbi:hypothetical protein N7445_004885 [Penicillium cf. griseofulvum]|nr:hypothetical protein N7445_004885 [Penicillium cf. griseofulvum]